MARILVIPDLHCPEQHPDAFKFLSYLKKKLKPNEFVCLGDEADFHSISRWPKDPDMPGAGDELAKAVKELKKLYKIFPRMKVCVSNHTIRPFKRAFESGIPSKALRSYREILESPPGWQWADAWTIDGIRFIHGEGISGGPGGSVKAAVQSRQSLVHGHGHSSPGFIYAVNHSNSIFGFNVGALISPSSRAFSYGKHSLNKPGLGAGIILNGVPHFIPLRTNKKGRWLGKI